MECILPAPRYCRMSAVPILPRLLALPESLGQENALRNLFAMDILRDWVCGNADSDDVGAGVALCGAGVWEPGGDEH
jgi:hypothetical protein